MVVQPLLYLDAPVTTVPVVAERVGGGSPQNSSRLGMRVYLVCAVSPVKIGLTFGQAQIPFEWRACILFAEQFNDNAFRNSGLNISETMVIS